MAAKKKPEQTTTKRGRGRPSKFTDAVATEICERLGKGEPLAAICRDRGMPNVRTVSHWKEGKPRFSAHFALARDEGFDAIAADCLNIADTPLVGKRVKTSKDGTETVIEDMLGHRKLQIETRLKLLAKWDPRRYGEKLDVTSGSDQVKITVEIGENVDD